MKQVTLITDGACLSNPGPGGWAALLRYGKHEKMLSGTEAETTNNRMEIMAVVGGLQALKEPCAVRIIVDSRYVMDAFEKGWIDNWRMNGWKTAGNKPVKNQELWELLAKEIRPHKVTWEWVKGHNGHIDNERVDKEAQRRAQEARGLRSPGIELDEP